MTTDNTTKAAEAEQRARSIVNQGDRDAVVKAIKTALEQRSRKKWSVTGGRGTAYGWIAISAPPARRTFGHRPKPGKGECPPPGKENWELVDIGEPGHCMSPADREELRGLLGLERIDDTSESIPAGSDYRMEYVHRALYGCPGCFTGKPYWD